MFKRCFKTQTHFHKCGKVTPNISKWFFSFWELKLCTTPIFWNKSVGNKFGPNCALNMPLERFKNIYIKCNFYFSIWNFELKLWPKKRWEPNWLLDSQPLKPKKQGPLTWKWTCVISLERSFQGLFQNFSIS